MPAQSTNHREFSSLVELLRVRVRNQPDARAYTFLEDGERRESHLTHEELDRRARGIAAALQELGGERAVLLYPPGLEYIAAFFGCLYAGVVAIPAYPPDPGRLARTLPRLQAIVADSRAEIVLTTAEIVSMAELLFEQAPDLRSKRWLGTDVLRSGAERDWREREIAGSSIAFLQYTSGSTGTPRGVVLTHDNLLANLEAISGAFAIDEDSIGVSWLPPYHDMGLIGGILAPLYRGRPTALMSPVSFLQRPARWLHAVSRFRSTISGGPNFAYELCIRKTSPEDRASLNLSSWKVAFSGAEPVLEETVARFVKAFAPHGFERKAFYPCYGLAEATLIVSGGAVDEEPVVTRVSGGQLEHNRVVVMPADVASGRALVACGRVLPGHRIVIARPESRSRCAADEVGEIWVAGPSVAAGYWHRPEESEAAFGGLLEVAGSAPLDEAERGPYMRTGDLGFVHDGQLYVTGRLKDLLIIRGRNHYPQDIERTAEQSHPALRRGCCAAFAVEAKGEERPVVAIEIDRRQLPRSEPDDPAPELDAICDAIRQAVMEQHELHVHDVVLVRPGGIPKTSSGKIQRRECKEQYLDRRLEHVASSVVRTTDSTLTTMAPGSDIVAAILGTRPEERHGAMVTFLQGQVARSLKTDASRVDVNRPVSNLGMDSLMAIELTHRLEKMLGVVLPQTSFLRDVSIGELADQALEQLTTPREEPQPRTSRRRDEGRLSRGQEALWFLTRLAPESRAYHLSRAVRIASEVDTGALRRALQILIDRHGVLRTTYVTHDERPLQRIADAAVDLEEIDARAWSEEQLYARVSEHGLRPFDLERGPLFRVALFTRSVTEHVLAISTHHIAADLWSLVVLLTELRSAYATERAGGPLALRRLDLDYGDFVRWQEEALAGPEGERSWAYWRRQLAGAPPMIELPTDRPRPPLPSYRGASLPFTLDPALTERVKELAREQGVTLYVVLLALWGAILSRHAGQDDVVLGSPVAGRSRAGFERVVGYFVNPVALRLRFHDGVTVRELLAQVRGTVLGALEHQDYPLPLLVQRLSMARDASRSPLFQVLFALEKSHVEKEHPISLLVLGVRGAEARLGDLALSSYAVEERAAQFDLGLAMVDTGKELAGALQYSTDLFDETTVARLCARFRRLIEAAVAGAETRVADLPLMDEDERVHLLRELNATSVPRETVSVTRRFEAHADRDPGHPALRFEGNALSYGELDRRANQLAHRLRELGARPESFVAVVMDRSLEMVVALLGVLKAGAAYLPVDPLAPSARIAFVLADAGAAIAITQPALADLIPAAGERVALEPTWSAISSQPEGRLGLRIAPGHPVYAIYTSGSTGRPKGVVNVHAGLENRLAWMQSAYPLTPVDRVVQKTPATFDVSVWEFFWPLTVGAQMVIAAPERHGEPAYLTDLLAREGVSVVHFVPSMLSAVLDAGGLSSCGALRHVFSSGEPLGRDVEQRFFEQSEAALHNLYGPTEASIDVTAWDCVRGGTRQSVPIGRPIANTEVYVLDRRLAPVPTGVLGELYLGGVGLARGYLRRPDLTAASFVPDPFSGRPGARLYRTGDLVRRSHEDDLEFVGRVDDQVKVRGFRIELGEIEAAMLDHPGVREAAAVVFGERPEDRRLAAYVVVAADGPAPEDLRGHLGTRLPDYMVPPTVTICDSLPRSPSGKIDRRALASRDPRGREAAYVDPRTPLEQVIAGLYEDVLRVQHVGIHDDFFALGGHSLLAAQLVTRLREALPVDLPLRTLFQRTTVAELATAILSDAVDRDRVLRAAELYVKLARLSDEDVERLLADRES